MRQYPNAAFATNTARASATGIALRRRRLSATPAETKPSRNVTPRNPTSEAPWIRNGATVLVEVNVASVLSVPPGVSLKTEFAPAFPNAPALRP